MERNSTAVFLYSYLHDGTDDGACEPQEGIAMPIIIIFISSIGLVANSAVILTVIVLQEYRKVVTNIYVLQLAMADFIFLFQLPFQARTMILGKWTYGTTWCKLSESIKALNYYCSVMFLTAMSVDRSLAINFAMNQKVARIRTKRAALLTSFFLWVLGFLSVINVLIYAGVKDCHCGLLLPDEGEAEYLFGQQSGETPVDEVNYIANLEKKLESVENSGSSSEEERLLLLLGGTHESTYYDTFGGEFGQLTGGEDRPCFLGYGRYYQNWVVCTFTLAFLLPLMVICVSYALILRRIVRPLVVGKKSQPANKTRKRATLMVIALVSVFTVCWFPYHALHIAALNGLNIESETCVSLVNFTLILAYSNSAINPFLYTFMGTNFRRRWGTAIEKARKLFKNSSSRSVNTHVIQTAETRC